MKNIPSNSQRQIFSCVGQFLYNVPLHDIRTIQGLSQRVYSVEIPWQPLTGSKATTGGGL